MIIAMKRIVFCSIFLFTLQISLAWGKVCDQVVAVLDNEVITLSEVDAAMSRYGKANLLVQGDTLEKEVKLQQARREVLDLLIEERLLERVATRLGIKVDASDAEMAMERIRQAESISEEDMKKDLVAHGFTVDGYRQFLIFQIKRSRIIDTLIKPDVSVAESKLREYFDKNAQRYITPEVRVSQILIKVPAEPSAKDWQQAKRRMGMVLDGLKRGTSFEKMAALYSDDAASARAGGDLGFFSKGEMIPTLEEVVFNLEVGEISGVIQSTQGLHLLKVTDKRPGSIPAFEDVRERVTADYYHQEVSRLYTKWLQELKSRANIEIKL